MSVEIMGGRSRRKKWDTEEEQLTVKKRKTKKELSGQVSLTRLPHYNKL